MIGKLKIKCLFKRLILDNMMFNVHTLNIEKKVNIQYWINQYLYIMWLSFINCLLMFISIDQLLMKTFRYPKRPKLKPFVYSTVYNIHIKCVKLYCLALNYHFSEMYSLETFDHCTFNTYVHIVYRRIMVYLVQRIYTK